MAINPESASKLRDTIKRELLLSNEGSTNNEGNDNGGDDDDGDELIKFMGLHGSSKHQHNNRIQRSIGIFDGADDGNIFESTTSEYDSKSHQQSSSSTGDQCTTLASPGTIRKCEFPVIPVKTSIEMGCIKERGYSIPTITETQTLSDGTTKCITFKLADCFVVFKQADTVRKRGTINLIWYLVHTLSKVIRGNYVHVELAFRFFSADGRLQLYNHCSIYDGTRLVFNLKRMRCDDELYFLNVNFETAIRIYRICKRDIEVRHLVFDSNVFGYFMTEMLTSSHDFDPDKVSHGTTWCSKHVYSVLRRANVIPAEKISCNLIDPTMLHEFLLKYKIITTVVTNPMNFPQSSSSRESTPSSSTSTQLPTNPLPVVEISITDDAELDPTAQGACVGMSSAPTGPVLRTYVELDRVPKISTTETQSTTKCSDTSTVEPADLKPANSSRKRKHQNKSSEKHAPLAVFDGSDVDGIDLFSEIGISDIEDLETHKDASRNVNSSSSSNIVADDNDDDDIGPVNRMMIKRLEQKSSNRR